MNRDEKHYLSREKHKQLQEELQHLKNVRRKEIAEALESAKQMGDLSENAEYHEARADQAALEERIVRIEAILRNTEIVESHHSTLVEVGSTVILQKEGEGDSQKYSIVGSDEADLASRKISNESPMGVAILGKKKGEVAMVRTPRGEVKYKVVDIE